MSVDKPVHRCTLVSVTTTTLPEIRALPLLDTAKITADAEAWVNARLSTLTDPESVAKEAGLIITKARAAAEVALADRDAAVYTLDTRYHLRRGANLAGAAGLQSRSRLTVIREKCKDLEDAGKFTAVEGADRVLPKVAKEHATQVARAKAAEPHRDAAILDLAAQGWSNARIAALVGLDPSQVSRIKSREEVA